LLSPDERVVEVHTSPVLSPDTELVARRWAFHDITETKQLERNLIQAQKMDAIGRLSGGVAHDFNNLLTAIRGNLELAKLTTDNEAEQREYLNAAEVGTNRAAEIVGQLLSYSRKSRLELRAGNVNEVIAELTNLLGHSFGANIVIETNLDEELWLADIDTTHFVQVIMNMCVNARDAFPEGRGRILISTSNVQTDDRECIHIRVHDNGSGMNGATLDKIFEPFFTTKQPGKGSGLGLATSLGIVEQHDGQIVCESTEGCGSCFRIELPRSQANMRTKLMGDSDHLDERVIVTKPTSKDLGNVLVIDDEESIRNLAQAMLQRAGFRVSVASCGNAGLDQLERDESITAVLLDLTMPGLSGIETLRAIRARFPRIAVVLSSGSLFDPKQFEDCRSDSFLSKPYRYQELIDTITTWSRSIRTSAA